MAKQLAKAIPAIPTMLPAKSMEGGLTSYLQYIHQIPVLSSEEEFNLATRYKSQGDLKAAQQLVLANLRFVERIAKGYLGYGLQLGDLIQEGTIGLMKAVKRFDPKVGVRLVSFAVHWIKAEIHEFVIKNWRIVKIATTKAQRKLFFNLRSCKKRLGWFNKQEVEAVAKDLKVKPEEVLAMEARMANYDEEFDAPETDEPQALAPAHYLPGPKQDEPLAALGEQNFNDHAKQAVIDAVKTLDKRSQEILAARWLTDKKTTFKDLAAKFNISIERVRQIEKSALEQLRHIVAE